MMEEGKVEKEIDSPRDSKKRKLEEEERDPGTVAKVDHMEGISFETVCNDYSQEAGVRLVDLKNIFSRQLPKMPKEYIVRLVFDPRHISVAMLRHGRAIGGICYRPYPSQRFGEIAFCAISGNEQLKGYGSLLMNHLKVHAQKDKIEYFLTYADNYAIGYFQRQGFSKSISMPKERWFGYIKDYDGGTLMECYVHPGVDYLHVRSIVAKQRAFIYQRIKEKKESETVYDGLELFQTGGRLQSLLEAPGLGEAGWTSFHLYKGSTERDRNMNLTKLQAQLKPLLDKVRSNINASSFRLPVPQDDAQFPGYRDLVRDPIDLSVILARLKAGDFYRNKDMMREDLLRMVQNALLYHGHQQKSTGLPGGLCGESDSIIAAAKEIEKLVLELFADTSPGQQATGTAAASGGSSGGNASASSSAVTASHT